VSAAFGYLRDNSSQGAVALPRQPSLTSGGFPPNDPARSKSRVKMIPLLSTRRDWTPRL